jgi:hypothetical protein
MTENAKVGSLLICVSMSRRVSEVPQCILGIELRQFSDRLPHPLGLTASIPIAKGFMRVGMFVFILIDLYQFGHAKTGRRQKGTEFLIRCLMHSL